MSRIRELDSLRGVAALGVVLHHGLFYTGALPEKLVYHLRSTPAHALVQGRPFVLVFFVLSGFVLSQSLARLMPSVSTYVAWSMQRALRLMLPTAMSVMISGLLYRAAFDGTWPLETAWMQTQNWAAAPDAQRIAAEGLLLEQGTLNNVLWSLIIELRISLLIPLLVWGAWTRDRRMVLLLAAIGLFGFAGGAKPWSLIVGDDPVLNLQVLLYFLLPFVVGICLERSGLCALAGSRLTLWAAVFAVAGLARVSSDAASVLGAGILIWSAQQPGWVGATLRLPLLARLGQVSFSLYLIHVPVLLTAFHLLHAHGSPLAIAGLAIAGALPAAWLFHYTIEGPSHRLARTIAPRRSAPLVDEKIFAPGQVP